ncbi:hypothetical protein DEF23_00555 [Marinitenerispora sediminis]|uniref:DUF3800 domain-containing protein n=1 Tax=Marinitenerispora sediminis TaxID=1931232 RepID=A0A368T941_9ACTN|nr:hypothetical protein DEF28_13185 [Marinitenerispora sediminis]RCV60938.1 hypothetical protein DEF24_05595 [Marinitenerispora sediminis]RCV62229.1 hypothetical protein DEF23_00555 [Marinitenerispora sediminis]
MLQHVMEQVNSFARAEKEHVLIIADEVADQDDHRQKLWEYKRDGTPGYQSSKLDRIVDTIHFAPSKASRLLQAVDLIAFLHRRRETHVETDDRARRVNDRLWSHVKIRVQHEHVWLP